MKEKKEENKLLREFGGEETKDFLNEAERFDVEFPIPPQEGVTVPKYIKYLAVAAIVAVILLFSQTAHTIVEEILVVGSKISTGYSDPAHDNSTIEAIESTELYTPGGPGGFAAVGLNGTDSKHTTVYRNGVPVNDPSSGWYDFGIDLPMWQTYQKISGPNSVLFGSSSMAGTILIEDTFDKHVFYKGGDALQFITGGNDWFQIARYKGSIGSVKTTNDEEDWYENTTLKTKSNIAGFDVVLVSQDYSYDYDDCLVSTVEYNDCNQSGYKTDLSIRNDWLTVGYNLNSSKHNTGWGAKSSRVFADARYQYKSPAGNFLAGVTTQQEDYDYYFRSPVPTKYKAGRSGVYFNWSTEQKAPIRSSVIPYKFGIGYRYEDNVQTARAGVEVKDFRISLGNSFRNPNLYERYGDDWVSPNPDLNAEKGLGLEVGWKDLTFWHYDFSDGIDFDFDSYQYINTGEYQSSGIKFSKAYQNFNMFFQYTDTDKIQAAKYKTRLTYSNMFGKLDYGVSYVGEFDKGLDYAGRTIDNVSTLDLTLGYLLGVRYRVGLQIRDIFNRKFEILPEYTAGGREFLISFDLSL